MKETKKSKTILVVDDETEMTQELSEILKGVGYKVKVAHDGYEALAIIDKRKPDLILLDIKMPKMDGAEFYDRLLKIDSGLPVIVITGSFAKEEAEAIVKKGGRTVMYKPFDVDLLLDEIKKYIN